MFKFNGLKLSQFTLWFLFFGVFGILSDVFEVEFFFLSLFVLAVLFVKPEVFCLLSFLGFLLLFFEGRSFFELLKDRISKDVLSSLWPVGIYESLVPAHLSDYESLISPFEEIIKTLSCSVL